MKYNHLDLNKMARLGMNLHSLIVVKMLVHRLWLMIFIQVKLFEYRMDLRKPAKWQLMEYSVYESQLIDEAAPIDGLGSTRFGLIETGNWNNFVSVEYPLHTTTHSVVWTRPQGIFAVGMERPPRNHSYSFQNSTRTVFQIFQQKSGATTD